MQSKGHPPPFNKHISSRPPAPPQLAKASLSRRS